ncbi:branched-chain alpha-keto acid dehydrogenase subunit E2 [Halobacteriales archaeon QS_5_70_17]|nr:MAG: branched-chain alpha-keto acid dehydrogenase subunit E2 [Halobacteriales archaeon QS_5_70_17]
MARREFKLPDVGEGLTEAEIVSWLVEVGDTVSEDQPVAEVETDKAVVEVPAPVDGTVAEIRAEEGEMVPVGEVIIVFETESGGGATAAEEGVEPGDAEGTTATEQAGEAGAEAEPGGGASADTDAGAEAEPETPEGRVFAAPSARRLARELGVDIASVEGSGPGGRISEADVRARAEDSREAAAPSVEGGSASSATRRVSGGEGNEGQQTGGASAGGGAGGPTPAGRDRTLAAPATRRIAEERGVDIDDVPTDLEREGQPFVEAEQVVEYAEAQQRAQAADAAAVEAGGETEAAGAGVSAAGEDERVPYRGVRRTIGQQMERSKYTAPHVTHHDEADVTDLVEARGELAAVAEERGIRLTYLPIIAKAVVAALKEFPYLNSQLDEDSEEIVLRGEYNLGIAVGTDAGLMVPVVEGADRKGTLQLASEMNELIEKARERTIARDEMQGGTFTITNFGAIGGEYATPIINYPETAILGLGAIKQKPRVVDGEVVPRHVLTLSLSIDHRVIDGAEAARFTNRLIEYLENPTLLLLE